MHSPGSACGEEFGSHLGLAWAGFIAVLQERAGMMDSVLCWENSPAPAVTGARRAPAVRGGWMRSLIRGRGLSPAEFWANLGF